MTWPISVARRNGFTLLEMIVVLVVLGLAVGLVVGHGAPRNRALEARNVAVEVARTLREARGQAIAGNRTVLVAVDLARHAIAIDGGRVRLLPPEIAMAMRGEAVGRRTVGIRFDADGSASGGQIELSDQAHRMEVSVNWLTGRVQVRDAPAS